jgi:hypothetical protein
MNTLSLAGRVGEGVKPSRMSKLSKHRVLCSPLADLHGSQLTLAKASR